MFSDIADMKEFERFFFQEICPYFLSLPGIVRVDITSISPISTELAQDVQSVQLIFDVIYEDAHAMDRIIHSPAGQKVNMLATQLDAKMSIFYGQEKSLYPYDSIPE